MNGKSVQHAAELTGAAWRKSTHSGDNGGSCVEVAPVGGAVAIRDSKDPSGPAFLFDRQSWSAFVAGVRDGDFNAR